MRDYRLSVYNASAGSGKTFQIANNFLQKLLSGNSKYFVSRLIGLTFTNDAANEMKRRILSEIIQAAKGEFSDLINQVVTLIRPEIENQLGKTLSDDDYKKEIIKRSQLRCKEILHGYDDFNLMTIDKLSYKIIRTFAREMDIPYDVNIIMDHREVIDNLIDEIISEAQKGEVLMNSLIALAKENAENEKSWDIKDALLEIVNILFDENHRNEVAEIKKKNFNDFLALKNVLLDKKRQIISNFTKFYQRGMQIISPFEGLTNDSVIKRIKACASPQTYKGVLFTDTMLKILSGEKKGVFYVKGRVEKLPFEQQSIIKSRYNDELMLYLTDLLEFYEKEYPNFLLINGLLNEINSLIIMNALERKIAAFKEQNHSIFINDFNFLIQEQLLKDLGTDTPFIYMRLGEKFIHYFLDEFQDTSELQWENMIPLIKESLSKDFTVNFPGETLGETMIVGDAKQSIYRFRNGKPEIFIDLSNPDLKDKTGNPFADVTGKRIEQMPYNWRSLGNIINFNNEFFTLNKKFLYIPEYRKVYDYVKQEIPKNKLSERQDKGYVQIQFAKKLSGRAEEGNRLPELVYNIIKDVKKRGYAFGDICFLFGAHKTSEPVAEYLTEKNIPVVSQRSLLVERASKVRFLVDMMKYLAFKTGINLYEALHFIFKRDEINKYGDLLIKLTHLNDIKLVLGELKRLGYELDLEWITGMSPYDLSIYLIEKFRLSGTDEKAYLEAFLDEVHEFTTQNKSGLSAFLRHWDDIKSDLSLTAAENSGAVRFMSVHASKGLEFPIVIFVGNQTLLDSRLDKSQIVWIDVDPEHFAGFKTLPVQAKVLEKNKKYASNYKQSIEEKKFDNYNKLYVAHTRASRELYIITPIPSKTVKEHPDFAQLYEGFLQEKKLLTERPEEEIIYSIGKKTFPEKKEKQEITRIQVTDHLNYWGDKNKLKIRTDSYEYWNESKKAAIAYGLEIHTILSKIHTQNDWKTQKEKFLATISEQEKEQVSDSIEAVIYHPELAEFYTDKYQILNERALLIPSDNIFRIKRPDRILLKDKKAIIIDYKTGEKHEKHKKQLESYAEILEETGYSVTDKFLVYIGKGVEIMKG